MSASIAISFVVAANSRAILESNFLMSPCAQSAQGHQVILQWNYKSGAAAYNDALTKTANDLIVFAHQDVYLPSAWVVQLQETLALLAESDPRWGVLGCYGANTDGTFAGYLYSSCQGLQGSPLKHPVAVQTLDEIVLVVRKSSGLQFDPTLPHFHLYGTDICLRAAQKGMRSYAISAPCIHNAQQSLVLPQQFYEACAHVRQSWKNCLPIQTTCVRLTRSGLGLHKRRLHDAYLQYIRRRVVGTKRLKSVQPLLDRFEAARQV